VPENTGVPPMMSEKVLTADMLIWSEFTGWPPSRRHIYATYPFLGPNQACGRAPDLRL
jgi:hypothetical protein